MKLLVFTLHDFVNVLSGSERMILVLYNQPFQDVYPTTPTNFKYTFENIFVKTDIKN